MSDEGLITVPSRFSVRETMERLAQEISSKGLTTFANIDHAAGARNAGFDLRPTELIIFGSPKGGTPLMMENSTAGIDLPVKALAWEDPAGRVWLTYNDIRWLAQRHHLTGRSEKAIAAIEAGLASLCRNAAGAE